MTRTEYSVLMRVLVAQVQSLANAQAGIAITHQIIVGGRKGSIIIHTMLKEKSRRARSSIWPGMTPPARRGFWARSGDFESWPWVMQSTAETHRSDMSCSGVQISSSTIASFTSSAV